MKKILVLISLLVVMACGVSENKEVTVENNQQITYVAEGGTNYELKTEDNFETAELNGIKLVRKVSADGILLESEDGKFLIHIKGNEALLTEDGKDINLTEQK